MLRYRIARNVSGRHVVFAVSISVVPINETYATRAQAQGTADWLNSLSDKEPPEKALPRYTMRTAMLLLLVLATGWAEAKEPDPWRIWTSANGKFKVKARLLSIANGVAKLERKDKAKVDVKLELLCPDDNNYVEAWKQDRSKKPKVAAPAPAPDPNQRQPTPAEREAMEWFKEALTAGVIERRVLTSYFRNQLRSRPVAHTEVFPDGTTATHARFHKPAGMENVRQMYENSKSIGKGEYLASIQPPLRQGAVGVLGVVRSGGSILRVAVEITQVVDIKGCLGKIHWHSKGYDNVMFKMDTTGLSDGQTGRTQGRLFRVGEPYQYTTVLGAARTVTCLYEIVLDPELVKIAREEWLKLYK